MKKNLNKIISSMMLTGALVGGTGCSVSNSYGLVSNKVNSVYDKATGFLKSDDNGYIGKQPITLKTANFHDGTIKDFVSEYVNVESKRDAASVDREKRCLENMVGKPFTSKSDLYNEMDSCVARERVSDIAKYGIGAFLIDGLKVYLLLGGVSSSSTSSTPSSPTTYNSTIGTGSQTSQVFNAIK